MESIRVEPILEKLHEGKLIPYLGQGVLDYAGQNSALPANQMALVESLTAKSSVPARVRKNLSGAAQFIENFKHRHTVKKLMTEAFTVEAEITALHRLVAGWPNLSMIVHLWYDDVVQHALAQRSSWGIVQGVSGAEHNGEWVRCYAPNGSQVAEEAAMQWKTLLYEPWGSVAPAQNYLVSDSDFVEVLTEIDIQTPIPAQVQSIRSGRSFLFLGCRFSTQLERQFARQILKRSSDCHWAVFPDEPSRNEEKFFAEMGIQRVCASLNEFISATESALSAQ